jgi:hypothetical protein
VSAVPSGEDETGILVRCRVHPFGLLLLFFKTTVAIDGMSHRMRWGEQFYPCAPGDHRVEVSVKYLTEDVGHASIDVSVSAGQVVRIKYQSPPMMSLFLMSREGSIGTMDT